MELAFCNLLTIYPRLLSELQNADGMISRKLDPANAAASAIDQVSYDEKSFRLAMNEDAMAMEKTAEGIRGFAKDIVKLEKVIEQKWS